MGDIDNDERQIDLEAYIEGKTSAADTPPLADHLEDVEAEGPAVIDPDKALTDDTLEEAGIVPVKAYMRTRASKNAVRVKRAAEKRESGETGPARKQLNLQAPVSPEAREALKELNTALLENRITVEDLDALAGDREAIDWRARALAAEAELAALRSRPWWQFWAR